MPDKHLDRTRALAGVFQAAATVKELAVSGRVNTEAYETCINSIFKLDPDSVTDIYGADHRLKIGLSSLELALKSNQPTEILDTVRYALSLLHVENLLQKQDQLLGVLRSRIETTAEQSKHFDSLTNEVIITQLADIYVDTISTFRYRIQVKGDANLLQQSAYANQIRATLLAGVRSAILWRQLGGRRWQLMFFRNRELGNTQTLLKQI